MASRATALLRRSVRAAATRAGSDVSVTVDGLTYVVDPSDGGPGEALFVWRVLPEFAALRRVSDLLRAHDAERPGTVLVDVGANIGTTSLPALARWGFTRSVAIEPDARNVRVLGANAALNGFAERVEIVAAAAADTPGEATFAPGKDLGRGRHRSGAGALRDDRAGERVRVVTVDGELARLGLPAADVGLLWVDVQGHEARVALGARSLIEQSCPFVFAARLAKLERLGDAPVLTSLLAEHYRYVADVRAPDPPRVLPVESLGELLRPGYTTDILAFGSPR